MVIVRNFGWFRKVVKHICFRSFILEDVRGDEDPCRDSSGFGYDLLLRCEARWSRCTLQHDSFRQTQMQGDIGQAGSKCRQVGAEAVD